MDASSSLMSVENFMSALPSIQRQPKLEALKGVCIVGHCRDFTYSSQIEMFVFLNQPPFLVFHEFYEYDNSYSIILFAISYAN